MRISTRHISLVAGETQGKMFFLEKNVRIQGKGERMTPKNSNRKERVYYKIVIRITPDRRRLRGSRNLATSSMAHRVL